MGNCISSSIKSAPAKEDSPAKENDYHFSEDLTENGPGNHGPAPVLRFHDQPHEANQRSGTEIDESQFLTLYVRILCTICANNNAEKPCDWMLPRGFSCKMVDFIPLWEDEGLKELEDYTRYIHESCAGEGRVEFRGKFCLPEKELPDAELIVRKAIKTGEPCETGHVHPFELYQQLRSKVRGVSDGKYERDTDLFYFELPYKSVKV